MPFFATMPITMISPMNEETLKVVRVISSARNTPEVESTAEERIASGAENDRNSNSSTRKISTSASNSTTTRSWNDFCCSLIGAAILHANRGRHFQVVHRFLHRRHAGAQVQTFQARRDFHVALQIVAQDFRLAGKFA